MGRSLLLTIPFVAAGAVGVAWASHVTSHVREQRVVERPSDMVKVPEGSFIMGMDDEEEVEFLSSCVTEVGSEMGEQICNQANTWLIGPFATGGKRSVYLGSFQIDRYEVTNAKYRACVTSGACDMHPLVAGDTRYTADDLPVVNVTYDEATTYCKWRGERLPTEAEWEKAARGAKGYRYPWGMNDHDDASNRGAFEPIFEQPIASGNIGFVPDESDGAKVMVAPGRFGWDKSPYGVYDMGGNVSEWVEDWYSESGYGQLSTIDQRGPSTGVYRSVRGGDFLHARLWSRTYFRGRAGPDERSITRGFRCAK
jgi:formylglycine-generating enzyme required for sulfatase activity